MHKPLRECHRFRTDDRRDNVIRVHLTGSIPFVIVVFKKKMQSKALPEHQVKAHVSNCSITALFILQNIVRIQVQTCMAAEQAL